MKTQCSMRAVAKKAIVALLACQPFADALSVGAASQRIEPELDPKSDKKFFGPPFPADYPSDQRPTGKPDFSYPFPHLQHAAKYDEDYVKDENTDHGEWKAQNDYDLAKARLERERREMEAARAKEEEEKGKVSSLKDADAQADGKLTQAMTREEKIKYLQGVVNDKIQNLDNCQQQLEDARKELKDFVEAIEGGLDFENKTAEAQKEKADAEEDLGREENELADAKKATKTEAADVEDANEELEKAESRLRAIRNAGKYAPAPPPPTTTTVQSGAQSRFSLLSAAGSGVAAILAIAMFA